ncbi:MAG: CAP domain-containing protein [Verrucomicrobiota bacterium]
MLMVLPLAAAPGTADEMLVAFRAKAAAGEGFDELLAAIPALPAAEQKRLLTKIDTTWPRLRDDFLRDLGLTAKTLGGKKNDNRQEISKHRAAFKDVYAKDEAAMKPLLTSESMPAVEQLRKLLIPDSAQIMATGGAKLEAQRKWVVGLAKFRDGTLKALGSSQPLDSASSLEAKEKAVAEEICGFGRGDVRILAQNRKLAKDKGVPEAEVRGIEECNELRMLVGLNALILDPKLCAAGRDHSKDMAEKDFFAHESPVSGKRLPWDRAKNFGTTASSENIFMGSSDSHEANMGWFYSPGHHKNMFMPGLARIGMGCTGNHWTQMFGR